MFLFREEIVLCSGRNGLSFWGEQNVRALPIQSAVVSVADAIKVMMWKWVLVT